MLQLISRVAIIAAVAFVHDVVDVTPAQAQDRGIRLSAVSSRPEFVTGGDVLVRVDVPAGTAAGSVTRIAERRRRHREVPRRCRRTLSDGADRRPHARTESDERNGRKRFGPAEPGQLSHYRSGALVAPGAAVRLHDRSLQAADGRDAGAAARRQLLDRHARRLRLPSRRREPISSRCRIRKPFRRTPPWSPSKAKQVPFIVRIETGTINRAIYQIAMLHNPAKRSGARFLHRAARGWNGRLIYTFGGGCEPGWYQQGASTGGVMDDAQLRQGYAVASASLDVAGNNCNDLISAETMMMVKERFIEAYGVPLFTIGWGSSGGAIQQYRIARQLPGTARRSDHRPQLHGYTVCELDEQRRQPPSA